MTDIQLPLTGGCLCGACRYEISAAPVAVYACHCTDCQRQSGSAFGMTMVVKASALSLTAGEPAAFLRTMPSGRQTTIRFCGTCGSRLFSQSTPEYYGVRPGALDDTSWLKPAMHYWVKSGHAWARDPGAATHDTQPSDLGDAIRLWREQGLRFVGP
jgi:hypothetical protein